MTRSADRRVGCIAGCQTGERSAGPVLGFEPMRQGWSMARRFGNRRYSRLGNLRYATQRPLSPM